MVPRPGGVGPSSGFGQTTGFGPSSGFGQTTGFGPQSPAFSFGPQSPAFSFGPQSRPYNLDRQSQPTGVGEKRTRSSTRTRTRINGLFEIRQPIKGTRATKIESVKQKDADDAKDIGKLDTEALTTDRLISVEDETKIKQAIATDEEFFFPEEACIEITMSSDETGKTAKEMIEHMNCTKQHILSKIWAELTGTAKKIVSNMTYILLRIGGLEISTGPDAQCDMIMRYKTAYQSGEKPFYWWKSTIRDKIATIFTNGGVGLDAITKSNITNLLNPATTTGSFSFNYTINDQYINKTLRITMNICRTEYHQNRYKHTAGHLPKSDSRDKESYEIIAKMHACVVDDRYVPITADIPPSCWLCGKYVTSFLMYSITKGYMVSPCGDCEHVLGIGEATIYSTLFYGNANIRDIEIAEYDFSHISCNRIKNGYFMVQWDETNKQVKIKDDRVNFVLGKIKKGTGKQDPEDLKKLGHPKDKLDLKSRTTEVTGTLQKIIEQINQMEFTHADAIISRTNLASILVSGYVSQKLKRSGRHWGRCISKPLWIPPIDAFYRDPPCPTRAEHERAFNKSRTITNNGIAEGPLPISINGNGNAEGPLPISINGIAEGPLPISINGNAEGQQNKKTRRISGGNARQIIDDLKSQYVIEVSDPPSIIE